MKLLFAFLLLVIMPSAAFPAAGPTVITQASVDKDTVWSGKVLVGQPLKVSKGATLTVKPGCEVRFSKGAGLTVEGVLKASGKKAAPVVFTSGEKAPAPGDWAGISLVGAGEGTALKGCSISYAAAVSVSVCSPAITGCEIKNGVLGIALARKARPVISDNVIRDMTQGGINCQMGCAPDITGNTIDHCGPFAVTSSQDSQPAIQGNTISGCDTGVALSQSAPPVTGNTFKGNKTGLFLSSVGNGMAVRGNRFTGNETGLACQQFSNPLIERNEFTGNKEGLVCFRASSPLIRNNDVADNERGVICVQICSPKITANNIHDNKKGIYLDLSSYALINGNNIYGNDIQVELGNMSSDWEYRVNNKPQRGMQAQNITMASRGKAPLKPVGDDGARIMGYVDATGNWWGQDVTEEMEEKGPDANIKSFIDYYDVPTRTYEGYSGVYIQDRIKYAGWKKSRIKGAGL